MLTPETIHHHPPRMNTADPVLDLSVIIVNYNVREFLQSALESVQTACATLSAEIFVVDNNSADGSVEMVRRHFPDVYVIANADNPGFGRANNQGIRRARGRYLMILNPDTLVKEDTFTTMIRFMDQHPEAGAIGCQILNPDGTFARESRRAFPTPMVAFYRVSGLSRLFPKSRTFGRYNLTYLPIDQVAEIDALSGSCMLVRRAALLLSADRATHLLDESERLDDHIPTPSRPDMPLEIDFEAEGGAGLFDEDFFMYGEDLDWCFRIKKAGWQIYYIPDTHIIHYKGESTKKGELRYVKLFYGAMIQFVRKHFNSRYLKVLAAMLQISIVIRASQSIIAQTIHRLRIPITEWVLAALMIMAIGLVRSLPNDFPGFTPDFYYLVAPIYALVMVSSIGIVRGYGRGRDTNAGPVATGIGIAFLAVTTVSFFFKSIAYSRAVVLFGFGFTMLLLMAVRWIRRERNERTLGPPQTLVIGSEREALHLQNQLLKHPQPPFDIIGYISPDEQNAERTKRVQTLARLGTLSQLRDIVRLRHIDDVIFTAGDVSNETIFHLMLQLQDLPVAFKILNKGQQHVIGKAFIGDLTAPALVEAETTVHLLRSRVARRLFEIPTALFGLLLYPLVTVPGVLLGTNRFPLLARMATLCRRTPDVLLDRRALVGYDPGHPFRPPEEWALQPGICSVVKADPDLSAEKLRTVYWHYAQNQSAWLDLRILLRTLRP